MDMTQIDRMDARLNRAGSSLFFHRLTTEHAASRGIDNVFVLYGGRAGVMGDVTADQALSAFCFFNEQVVRDVWTGMSEFGAPSHVGTVFADAMAVAARGLWNGEAAETVVDLGARVCDSVAPMGMALFAGWRRLARETPEVSRVVHALRELRGDVHIQSVAAHGLGPLEAEMVTRGEAGAKLHGYQPPYPDPAPFVERVAAASSDTSKRMHAIYRNALSEAELASLGAAVVGLVAERPV
jgi:hypothetical protein